jgi:CubicO group peptidase (beta-lactamase class C family)
MYTLFGLIWVFTSVSGARPARSDDALKVRLDRVIDRALGEARIVGTVVLIARDGHVIYSRAAGWADREGQIPAREDTIFRLASMTKPLVSAATLALWDQGKLNLDDPVTRWLPEFKPKLVDGRVPIITIRELLTHSRVTLRFPRARNGPVSPARRF